MAGWPAYFVKDFVKSHKTGRGSIIQRPAELPDLLNEIRKYRGELEGGVCFWRVEDFVPDSETRYLFCVARLTGRAKTPLLPEPLIECARRIDSPFFSVDVALRADGFCVSWKSAMGRFPI